MAYAMHPSQTMKVAKMRIAQVAPLYEPVPSTLYGGTERVVSWLTEELVRRGHDVTLFASGDSRTRARLVPVVPRALRLGSDGLDDPVALHLAALEEVRRRAREFDVIHTHVDILAFPALRGVTVPHVATLHGRLDIGGLTQLYRHYRDLPLVSISDAQRAPLPNARWIGTVHHGLPLGPYRVGTGGGDYLVFLGRVSQEKGPDVAIRLARRAGVRLVIAAKVGAQDQPFFDEQIKPLLGPGVEFIGEVDDQQKIALLRDARALIFPVNWPEPFGLVMIESMACGTPVLARRRGSIPEVVAHGRTGFIYDDEEQLLAAIGDVSLLNRHDCRRWVAQRFSAERMARDYERVYQRLLDDHHFDPRVMSPHVHADIPLVPSQLEIGARLTDAQVRDAQSLEEGGQLGTDQLDAPPSSVDAEAEAGLEDQVHRA